MFFDVSRLMSGRRGLIFGVCVPKRDVVRRTGLEVVGIGFIISGDVHSPILQERKRKAGRLLGAGGVESHPARAAAAGGGEAPAEPFSPRSMAARGSAAASPSRFSTGLPTSTRAIIGHNEIRTTQQPK